MGIRQSYTEFRDQCQIAIDLVAGLPLEYAKVLTLHSELGTDGFPTASMGGGSGPSSITHTFTEPDGSEVELSVAQHSDRVGELVTDQIDNPDHEPWTAALNQGGATLTRTSSTVKDLLVDLESARGALLAVQKPRPEKIDEGLGIGFCFNCGRYESDGLQILNHTFRVGPEIDGSPTRPRCRHCYNWTRSALLIRAGTHPTEPQDEAWPLEQPGALVLIRDAGKRVYDPDVASAVLDVKAKASAAASAGAAAERKRVSA